MERSITSSAEEKDIGFLKGLIISIIGVILAVTSLFGKPSPFGAAVICGLNGFECIFLFFGASAGYMINGGFAVSVPYIAAMIVITVLRFIFGGNSSKLIETIIPVISGLCIFTANLFTATGVYDMLISLAFGIISYVFSWCAWKIRERNSESSFDSSTKVFSAAAGTAFVFLTSALTSLHIGIINIGVFICVLTILYSSDSRKEARSAVCAILASAGIAVGNGELAVSSIIISVTAPVIMLMGKHGRITRASVFIAITGLGMIAAGINEHSAAAAVSSTAAAIIYMAVPERYAPSAAVFENKSIVSSPQPFAAFSKKLLNMSIAVDDMKSAVIKTSEALKNENVHDISRVYLKTSDKICKNCANNMYCWGERYNDTADIMNKITEKMKNGHFADISMLGGHLKEECKKKNELSDMLNKQYAFFRSAENASRKVDEMRSILTGQLGATESMLRKMSEELEESGVYDSISVSEAEKVFKDMGLNDAVVIALNSDGKLSIDAYAGKTAVIDAEEVSDRLAFALRREFDLPLITEADGRLHIMLTERAMYDAQIRIFQKNKSGNRQSGDCCECFNDGNGSVYMILSDGMGSGSRARIDSTFAVSMLSKLLKAGIDMDASLEMINSSLLVKSYDESFATIDVCRIDLNSGRVLLCKAGGASTYVKCGKEFAEIKEGGLPLGTVDAADYDGKYFTLSEGDIIIMTSDGADINTKWLEQKLLRDDDISLDETIDTIGEALRLSQDKPTSDDITVIGVKIIK